jgi:hypothetical protein
MTFLSDLRRASCLIATITTLFALIASVQPGSASAATGRSVEIKPSVGPPGATVTVTGHGFPYQYCVATATLFWEGHGSQT